MCSCWGLPCPILLPRDATHLSTAALFSLVQNGFATIPDYRLSNTDISFTDALMSAFAMFSLILLLLLAFDKQRAEGNLADIPQWLAQV